MFQNVITVRLQMFSQHDDDLKPTEDYLSTLGLDYRNSFLVELRTLQGHIPSDPCTSSSSSSSSVLLLFSSPSLKCHLFQFIIVMRLTPSLLIVVTEQFLPWSTETHETYQSSCLVSFLFRHGDDLIVTPFAQGKNLTDSKQCGMSKSKINKYII